MTRDEARIILVATITHGFVSQPTWGAPATGPALDDPELYKRTAHYAVAQADAILDEMEDSHSREQTNHG